MDSWIFSLPKERTYFTISGTSAELLYFPAGPNFAMIHLSPEVTLDFVDISENIVWKM